jgi:hypothetical protein
MFIELERGQKIQLAAIVLMLLLAGGYVAYNWRAINGRALDDTLNAWGEKHTYGQDQTKPISETNPLDTAKTTLVNNFVFHDGALTITEYPADPARAAVPVFKPDAKVKDYLLYKPSNSLAAIGDPSKRALTWAATILPRGFGAQRLARHADLTDDQKKTELAARQLCSDSLNSVDVQVGNGTLEPRMYQAMLDALAQYKSNTEDASKSSTKKALGYAVIKASFAYLNAIEADRQKAIDRYVAAVEGIVNDDQRKKLADALPVYLQSKS